MAGPATGVEPFAPPRTPTRPERAGVRSAWWFVVKRGLRLVVGPMVLAVCVTLVLGLESRTQMLMAWASGILIWLPTTMIQLRVAFFPSPPDLWLLGDDGPRSARDVRAVYRSQAAEDLLGSLPPLWLAGWFATRPEVGQGSAGMLAAGMLSLMSVARQLQVGIGLALHEASLDLVAGDPDRARSRLEWLMRWPLPGLGDQARLLLARARFQTGDADGAIAALDRIRRPDVWQVEPMRIQMAIGRDGPGPARVVAERLRADPELVPLAEAITTLAELHEGHIDAVVSRADTLLALPNGEPRRLALLLLGAALAPTDPTRACQVLFEARWDPRIAASAARGWPVVAERLETLRRAGG